MSYPASMRNHLDTKEILDMLSLINFLRNDLFDISHLGVPFSWYNKKGAISAIFARIDRA